MLPREGTLGDLLGLLYESTTDDHAWELFLREVATATGGESAAIMLGKPPTDLHLVLHNWGLDPEGIRLYTEHYGKLDVWAAKGLQIPMTEWLGPSEALCSFDELVRTEFFNDFLIRYGVVHALFGAGQYLDGSFTNLSIFRNHKRGPFGSDDLELVRFLTPHIKRALRLHLEFNQLKGYSLSLQAALDSSPTAILLMDCNARVIVMNRMARTIIGQNDGLRIRHSRLQTEKVSDCHTLTKLLSQAGLNSSGTKSGCANGMLVSRKQRPPLQVFVAPAGRLQIAKEHPITTIMFINDPEQRLGHHGRS